MPSRMSNSEVTLPSKWEKLKKAREAYKSARFYMWIGLASGFTFLFLGRLSERLAEWLPGLVDQFTVPQSVFQILAWLTHWLAFIFEHLGVGLIVAAIAIFFYEWGAHIKETIELSSRLADAVDHTKQMMEAIRLNERLNQLNIGRAEARLPYVLDSLIGGVSTEKPKYLNEAVLNCRNLVLALASLNNSKEWASEQYVTFLSKHIYSVVGHNADAFSKLHEKKGEQHFIVPPTAAQMADEILAAQMESLSEMGRYDVISDLPSWQGTQLGQLHRATKLAIVNNEVQVRRVFNLIRGVPFGTKQTLTRHLEQTDQWKGKKNQGGYEVRILSADGYRKLKAQGFPAKKIEEAHFGVFSCGTSKVRFKVTEPDLSDMLLSRDPDLVDPSLEMFEAVWNVAEKFPAGSRHGEQLRERLDNLLHEMEEWQK